MKVVSNISSIQENTPPAITLFSSESSISLLGLSRRSFNALAKSGYDIVGKVLALDEESLETIEYLGKKSIKEIISIQERLRQQSIKGEYIESINIPDCRFIKTRETIYSTDYIGVLDISLKAHNVLYNAGIFSAGKLFDMEKEDIYNLKNANKKISEELLAFIAREKPIAGKIMGNEDIIYYIQEITQEQQDYRMNILEESYKEIPQNRLDKPLSFFLQNYSDENIQYSIALLLPILKKVTKISEIKRIFPTIVKTSRTNNVVRILELLSFNLIKFLNETLEPLFTEPRYTNPLDILFQRANGFTLQDIAENRNLTRERIRQIELKCTRRLVYIIKAFPINIISFICAETDNNDYISSATIREYLEEFEYNSQFLYLLENENIYEEYQYSRQYDVFYRSGLELDFSSLDIQRPLKELILNDKEVETGKKIEDFLIAKNLAKCTYNDICNFTNSEAGYSRVSKIIRLTNNIVEIEKDWYVHRSCIIDFNEAAEQLLLILKNQFKQFYGYSDSHVLYDAARIDLAMFMNDNGIETEAVIYMLAKHLFFKEKYKGHKFFFTDNLHIWEKQTGFLQNNKGVLINLAKATGGIITRDEAEKYLENVKISKNVILHKVHDISDSTFYFYKETTYVLAEYLQIDNIFISNVKKSLDKLFDNKEYIIPGDIHEDWFDTLPTLPLGLFWNLLLLQEIIRYNEEIGYKPLLSDIEQSPYRISGAFVKTSSVATLIDIIYDYSCENLTLPYRNTAENYRKLLRKAGFIHDMEWFTGMHKVFNDPRFAFSNENKNILVRK
jgi:hypothetical protein